MGGAADVITAPTASQDASRISMKPEQFLENMDEC